MVTFMVDLYHNGLFASNPLRYLAGEHRVIKDINFEALFENDCRLDMYTEHQGYDVLEMINDDRHCEDKSDSDFEDVKKGDNLDDVKDIVDFQTKGEENVNIPKLSIDDPWLNKLVGKGREVNAGKCAGKRGKGSAEGYSYKGKGKLGKDKSEPSKLLTAMGRDANNQMFPIAWAVVEVENKSNWCWFLSLLFDDLNLNDGAGLTVTSDGHKSIDSVLDTSMPTSRKNRTAMELNDSITPFARRHLEFTKIRQRKWVVYASGFQEVEVEVRRQDEAFGVNIHLKKCACNMGELIGLPCVHAVAGYIHLKKDLELGVTEWFSKNKWERDQYQQAGPSVDEIPKCKEDPVIPESSSGNKRKEPPEHAEIMDKEAFANLVKKDAENKAKEVEM
nr:hypothetical protein [Tanacetum cinerariifolium]